MFIIFKPGYASLELGLKDYFTGVVGRELNGWYPWNNELRYRVIDPGIVELPKVKSRDQRLKATPGHITEVRNKTPLLNRFIDEEDKALGLK
jgi:hypothetical protein